MPNFNAKVKDVPAVEAAPGAKVPEVDQDSLCYMGDGYLYMYSTDHSERDILRPGYFDDVVKGNRNAYHGALILYTARGGQPDPEDWRTGFIRLAKMAGIRGRNSDEKTLVAIVTRFGASTIVGHDGTEEAAEEPKPKGAAKPKKAVETSEKGKAE